MLPNLQAQLQELIKSSVDSSFKLPKDSPSIDIEIPNDKQFGEFSLNIAMKLTKILKKAPLDIASQIVESVTEALKSSPLSTSIEKIDIKKPGFINFYLTPKAICGVLDEVFDEKDSFGKTKGLPKQKIQIEFVSANPTGPLSVAHARQAAVGDALGNILKFLGFDLAKEYYINDKGNQIKLLGASVRIRAEEKLKGKDLSETMSADHYKGDYVKDIAADFMKDNGIKSDTQLDDKIEEAMSDYAKNYLLDVIKKDLEDFNVHFDVWSSESKVATEDAIEDVLAFLGEKGFIKQEEGAWWFQSTTFGDDKDRVLVKSDGTYTYLTPDIVYHKNKFKRGFDKVINIWGPDHHGYIPRIKAAAEALGYDRDDVEVLIVQLATIYRDGKALSMSTRQGEFISLREVIDEVGSDAARFFFLMRRINQNLEFDLELAKKQSSENPVYYVQYGHARITSILKKAKTVSLSAKQKDFSLLKEPEELDLIKMTGQFQDTLLICYRQLDPYALVNYLQELASGFHRFYDKHRVVDEENKELSAERLGLINAVKIVLANGLNLLGLSAPETM